MLRILANAPTSWIWKKNSGWYQRFFYWRIFTKFQPQKYDLDLYKGFFLEKMNKIRQIWKTTESKLPDFYDKL
jgi:hypothetical protein